MRCLVRAATSSWAARGKHNDSVRRIRRAVPSAQRIFFAILLRAALKVCSRSSAAARLRAATAFLDGRHMSSIGRKPFTFNEAAALQFCCSSEGGVGHRCSTAYRRHIPQFQIRERPPRQRRLYLSPRPCLATRPSWRKRPGSSAAATIRASWPCPQYWPEGISGSNRPAELAQRRPGALERQAR
jgi:hypothetical protein